MYWVADVALHLVDGLYIPFLHPPRRARARRPSQVCGQHLPSGWHAYAVWSSRSDGSEGSLLFRVSPSRQTKGGGVGVRLRANDTFTFLTACPPFSLCLQRRHDQDLRYVSPDYPDPYLAPSIELGRSLVARPVPLVLARRNDPPHCWLRRQPVVLGHEQVEA